jgi:thioredoxin-like negative regulator of GroEL
VRLAKIDADAHSSVKGTYEIAGFPTLIYFSNGQKIKYNGQRTKEFMVNWLNKKTSPAVTVIEAAQLEEIAANGKVNVVFHGDLASHENGALFQELATADDYNSTPQDM